MFVNLNDLRGLNTTEVSYPGAPSVEEQMTMFHSGPLDVVPETTETVKEAGHKQQAITSAWDGLGQEGEAAAPGKQKRGSRGGIVKKLVPFGLGVAVGGAVCYFVFGK